MTLREAGPIEEGDLRNPTGESPAQVLSEDSDTCNQPQSSSAHRREACPRSWRGEGPRCSRSERVSSVHRVRPECSRRATDRWRLANSIAFDPNGSAWVSDVRETSHGGTEREERHADRSPREGEGHRVAPCRRTHV